MTGSPARVISVLKPATGTVAANDRVVAFAQSIDWVAIGAGSSANSATSIAASPLQARVTV